MRLPRTAQGGRCERSLRAPMSLVERLFRKRASDARPHALYAAIVAAARDPAWYRDGAVPDTLDGRFDMVAAVLTLVLLRLESLGLPAREPSARLAELFVDDMDGQLRQIGIGDIIVGKHIGRMMAALGGRLGAYRDGLAGGDLADALRRNLYRGADVTPDALAFSEARFRDLNARLADRSLGDLLAGRLA